MEIKENKFILKETYSWKWNTQARKRLGLIFYKDKGFTFSLNLPPPPFKMCISLFLFNKEHYFQKFYMYGMHSHFYCSLRSFIDIIKL